MGTGTPPHNRIATSHSIHSSRVSDRMQTRSPGMTPSAARPAAISRAVASASDQVRAFHSPPCLYLNAIPGPLSATRRVHKSNALAASRPRSPLMMANDSRGRWCGEGSPDAAGTAAGDIFMAFRLLAKIWPDGAAPPSLSPISIEAAPCASRALDWRVPLQARGEVVVGLAPAHRHLRGADPAQGLVRAGHPRSVSRAGSHVRQGRPDHEHPPRSDPGAHLPVPA